MPEGRPESRLAALKISVEVMSMSAFFKSTMLSSASAKLPTRLLPAAREAQ